MNLKPLNPNTTEHMLRQRLIRIETKLCRLMDYLGVDIVDKHHSSVKPVAQPANK